MFVHVLFRQVICVSAEGVCKGRIKFLIFETLAVCWDDVVAGYAGLVVFCDAQCRLEDVGPDDSEFDAVADCWRCLRV